MVDTAMSGQRHLTVSIDARQKRTKTIDRPNMQTIESELRELVPKRLDTIAWQKRQWFDWDGLPICVVSLEGLVEMKRAAGRDVDLMDIKNLGFDPHAQQ